MKPLRENIISLFLLQGANYILPLLLVPYLVRVLGVANFGKIAFAQSFIQYFVIITDYGFSYSATRAAAQAAGNDVELSMLFSAVLFIKITLMLVGAVVLTFLVLTVRELKSDWVLFVIAYLSVLSSVLFPAWLYQGIEKARYIALYSIGAKAMSLLAVLLFVRKTGDYDLALALLTGSSVITGSLSLLALRRQVGIKVCWTGFFKLKQVAVDGWHVFLSNAAISFYTNSNTFVVGLLTSPLIVGYYAAADKIIRAAQGMISPLSQAVYPRVAALSSESPRRAFAFVAKLLRWQGGGALALSVAIYIAAPQVVKIILGNKFGASVELLRYMAILPFLIALSNVFGVQVMLNFGLKRKFSIIIICSAIFNIVILVPLTIIGGARGAAISVVVTEMLVAFAMAAALFRKGILGKLIFN